MKAKGVYLIIKSLEHQVDNLLVSGNEMKNCKESLDYFNSLEATSAEELFLPMEGSGKSAYSQVSEEELKFLTDEEEEADLSEREKNIMNEAFTIGRVYSTGGEVKNPADIHEELIEKCTRVAKVKDDR